MVAMDTRILQMETNLNRHLSEQEAGPVAERPTPRPTFDVPPPPPDIGGRYHLRAVSYDNTARSQDQARLVAQFLNENGITGAVARQSRGKKGVRWVVDVGSFSSIRSADAVRAKEKVRAMTYKGRADFKTADFVEY